MTRKSAFHTLTTLMLLAGIAQAQGLEQGLTAEQYNTRALELADKAKAQYPVAFYDLMGWKEAVQNAEAAVKAEPDNLDYQRTLGMLYTQTQVWYKAYQVWTGLEAKTTLDPEAKAWAALSAARIGYIRIMSGKPEEAQPFLEASLRWQNNPKVQALLERAEGRSSAINDQ
ncbi:MAG: hypothetical protein C4332_05995 [Meiothermus sp.]